MELTELWDFIALSLGVKPTTASLAVGVLVGLIAPKWVSFSREIRTRRTNFPVNISPQMRAESGLMNRLDFKDGVQEVIIEGDHAARLCQLVSEGNTIAAIKLVRESHRLGLREAKDIVDTITASQQNLTFNKGNCRAPGRRYAGVSGEGVQKSSFLEKRGPSSLMHVL